MKGEVVRVSFGPYLADLPRRLANILAHNVIGVESSYANL